MQNSIIFKILNENIKEDIPNIPKQISNENIVTKFQLKDTIPLKGKVKQICELEKEELLIVNIYNQDILNILIIPFSIRMTKFKYILYYYFFF